MYIMYYMYNITICASWADETTSLSDALRQQRLKVIKYSDKKHFQLLIVLDLSLSCERFMDHLVVVVVQGSQSAQK